MFASARSVTVGPHAFAPSLDVFWAPDGSGDVRTWDEVMTCVNAAEKPVTLWIGDDSQGPYVVPPGVYEMSFAWVRGRRLGNTAVVVMQDGAVLRNVGALVGVTVRCAPTTGPAFAYDDIAGGTPYVFGLLFAGGIENLGSVPAFDVATTSLVFAFLYQPKGFLPTSTAPIASVAPGRFAALFYSFGGSISTSFGPPNAFVAPLPGALCFVVHDGTLPGVWPFFTGFTGLLINNPAGMLGGAGPSANRPQPLISIVPVGCMYFDTDLAPPRAIFWDGAQWVDALGVGPV